MNGPNKARALGPNESPRACTWEWDDWDGGDSKGIWEISEVGGSEFAFRQAPPDREIVSCRACVRAVWMPSRIPDQIPGLVAFPFPFYPAGLSLFPFVIGFPFSLVH